MTVGVAVGGLLLYPFLGAIETGDRFFDPGAARQVYGATMGAAAALLIVMALGLALAGSRGRSGAMSRAGEWGFLVLIAGLSTILALNGLQFGVLGAGLNQELHLGRASVPFSVLWLLVAAYALRLLDGLHGAAPAVLGAAAVAVGWMSYANEARMAAVLCAVMAGAAFGSLRFHALPSPSLPLRGPGTVCFGLFLAILTLIARQKTVATLMLLFPLGLAVLLLGAAALTTLERSLQPGNDDRADEEAGSDDEGARS
jgi:UDP-N-acetylmuramyl pentapeptide phosphotransferase/UDP-N-acetylglucosamine-1-phosphate transferase